MPDDGLQNIERKLEELRTVVLDLQRAFKAPDTELMVRSCTSCLQDSCSKPPDIVAPTRG